MYLFYLFSIFFVLFKEFQFEIVLLIIVKKKKRFSCKFCATENETENNQNWFVFPGCYSGFFFFYGKFLRFVRICVIFEFYKQLEPERQTNPDSQCDSQQRGHSDDKTHNVRSNDIFPVAGLWNSPRLEIFWKNMGIYFFFSFWKLVGLTDTWNCLKKEDFFFFWRLWNLPRLEIFGEKIEFFFFSSSFWRLWNSLRL